MNTEKLYSYVTDQSKLLGVNLSELEKLTQEFPYFQTAHLLYAMSSKKNDASAFQRSIKKTAIVAVSRNHLYELLYTNKPLPTKVEEEKKPEVQKKVESDVVMLEIPEKKIEEVKIVERKVVDLNEQVEREIQKDVVEAFVESEILHTNTAHKKEIAMPVDASFGQWIKFLKSKNGEVETETKNEEKVEQKKLTEEKQQKKIHQKQLIDKIIEKNPSNIKLNKESKFFVAETKAKESLLENEELVTETLAKIYALQGNINKAIRAYQILSLKYPNKSAYFASLIEELRKGN